ncbi:MAG: penicillin acylase family protein [Bacteroidales bacterium]|nr:penicillin acylase family protein [Bacteroidales bacterium]
MAIKIAKDVNAPHLRSEMRLRHRDGDWRIFEITGSSLINNGKIEAGIVNLRDITERKQAEDALRKSEARHREREERYRNILDNMEEAYYEVDLKGDLTFFNAAAVMNLGYTDKLLMGLNFREYVDEENASKVFEAYNRVFITGESVKGVDWELISKESGKIPVESSISLIRDVKGKPVGFRGIIRDITERKRAEEALRESEEKFRNLTETAQDAIVTINMNGMITYANPAAKALAEGMAVVGMALKDFLPPDSVEHYYDQIFDLLSRGFSETLSYESKIIRTRGDYPLYFDVKSSTLWNRGEPSGILLVARDATDRKRTEEEIRRMAVIDTMTGLYNRRGFISLAEQQIKTAIRADKKMLLFNIPGIAEEAYSRQDDKFRLIIDSFARGMNDYAAAHPEEIGESFRQVLPVTPYDVLGHTARVTCLEFLGGDDIAASRRINDAGSNAIAIGPSRSASGNAMLLTTPHLPWGDFFTWFEAHLNGPGMNAYGIALVGMPSLSMAFNNDLGWAHTVNPIDASDRYELVLNEGGYLLDGKTRNFSERSYTIRVRRPGGSFSEEPFRVKESVHGPVLAEKGGKAVAVRIAGLRNYRIFEQYHKMARATDLSQFEAAVQLLQNPMFNILYADRKGNILYLFNGNIPVRDTGDFYFWRRPVDGTLSSLVWDKIHPYQDLPRLLNPGTGFLQNCNDPPWTSTYPATLRREDFPPYFAPQGMGLRPQRAVNMIRADDKISFEKLEEYKMNTVMESAERFLDDLAEAVALYPDTLAVKAIDVLKSWDKKTDSESRGAVLFAEWWDRLPSSMIKTKWNSSSPVSTPDGLADKEGAAKLLSNAATDVKAKHGSLDVKWGDVHRFRRGGHDYPANGGPDHYGIFRTIYYADNGDGTRFPVAGDTYIAITEFGETVKAEVLLGYGNSSQKNNPHNSDQMGMMAEKKLRPALLNRKEILENTELREASAYRNAEDIKPE